MTLLFGGGGGAKASPQFTGLAAQTSTSSLPIAIRWGRNRGSPNIIWQGDFASHKKEQKVGKGGPKQVTYTYSASFMLCLGWGEITDVYKVWRDQSKETDYATLGFSLFTGPTPQTPWGYLTASHPSAALGYSGIAYMAASNYDLGNANTLPQHSFEIGGLRYGTGYNEDGAVNDADPALIIEDYLSHPGFGLGFDMTILQGVFSTGDAPTTGDSTFQTYCRAAGFALSPNLISQETAGEVLSRWAMLCNTAVVWTGYALKLHPYGPDEITNNGVTYLPDFAVRYEVSNKDFICSKDEDPIKFDRVDPSDAFNSQSMIIANKENEYNDLPVPWRDQGLVDQFGLRKENNLEAKEVTDPVVASIMISLIGQRKAYVRNEVKFTLPSKYCRLEPMDVLSLTASPFGTFEVLIKEISETDDETFEIVAEEHTPSISASTGVIGYTVPPIFNTPINTGVIAGPVNPPIIFEPPSSLAGAAQVWAAVSGGDGVIADYNWGGAYVWLSTDGASYTKIGVVEEGARQGKTTAILATFTPPNPDAIHTLAVDLAMSGGELSDDATAADAETGEATLCYVDGELLSFENTTLTAPNEYDLENLWRGQFGSTIGAHASGSDFARLDDTIFKFTLPPEYIGVLLYLKFQSFNIFGAGVQDLADAVAYTYTPTGAGSGTGTDGAPATPLTFAVDGTAGPVRGTWDANSVNDGVTGYQYWRADGLAAAFIDAVAIGTVPGAATEFTDASIEYETPYTYFLVALNFIGASSPTAGEDLTTITKPWDDMSPISIVFPFGETIGTYPIDIPITFTIAIADDFVGANADVRTNPTATAVFTVKKNGSGIGTVTISTGGVATFVTTGAGVSLVATDTLTIEPPAVEDLTLAGVTITFAGTKG